MPGRSDCEVCPFADRPEYCHARDKPIVCRRIREGGVRGEKWRVLVWELTVGPSTPRPRYEPSPPGIALSSIAAVRSIASVPVAPFDPEVTRSILNCRVRGDANCGCGGKKFCHRAGLPRLVVFEDCIACVSKS